MSKKKPVRQSLAYLLKTFPPRGNETAYGWCTRANYKTTVIWSQKDDDIFCRALARRGLVIEELTDRIRKKQP